MTAEREIVGQPDRIRSREFLDIIEVEEEGKRE